MKNTSFFLLMALFALVLSERVEGSVFGDDDSLVSLTRNAANDVKPSGVAEGDQMGQSFTAISDGYLIAVEFHNYYKSYAPDAYLKIREWTTDDDYEQAFDGEVLATSGGIVSGPSSDSDDWQELTLFEFSSSLYLFSGTQYVIEIVDGMPYTAHGDPYAGGKAYETLNPGLSSDFPFITYTSEDPPEVAEPETTPTSVWVMSDQGSDEEGEYVFSNEYDGGSWYDKDGSGSIMWRADIDLRDVHDDRDLNGIWIRDNRGSGRNVGCTENNDPSDVTACTEWRANYGYEEVVEFSVWAYEPEDTDVAEDTIDNSPIRLDGDLADGDQGQRVVKGASSGVVIELQLNISSIVAIKGWSTILEIDTDQVEFTGSFTASTYIPGLIALSSSQENGFSVGGTVLGSNATGSGDGTLGQFSVELLDGFSDQTTIRIVEVTLNLESGEREKIAVMSELVISSEVEELALAGDFDGSGRVDFNDFFIFADGFGGSDPTLDLDGSGRVDFNDFFIFADGFGKEERAKLIALAIELIGLPQAASLGMNYPNPFNSETTIPYSVGIPGPVTMRLYDISGQLIRELVNQSHATGQYNAWWNGKDSDGAESSSGVYLLRLESVGYKETKKIMLMK